MNESNENAVPGPESEQQADDSSKNAKQKGLTSSSDWAEFSHLLQKLDNEYSETLASPPDTSSETPKSTNS